VTAAGFVLAALLRLQAADQIVVTAAPSIDAQRLADALRVYLDEFGIRVETRGAGGEADDLRKRIDERASWVKRCAPSRSCAPSTARAARSRSS